MIAVLHGVTNLDMGYDALGNITTKSDVGTYSYHPVKRHQVASTSNGWNFAYDNNGNMTSGRGISIDWTSYNYPSCTRIAAACSGGGDWSSFSYTPDRDYWRQISNYTNGGSATTIYAGGLLEKVTAGGTTDFRHYIHAGSSTIIVSRKSTGVNAFFYVTRDHLNSSSAVTDGSGGVLVNSSFDAFGKRLGSNWSGTPSASDWTAIAGTTRRGYTDHSMLDNLSLVHMGGRAFDSVMGRFISADPVYEDQQATQSWNRYSYVLNNPLTNFDPTGFAPVYTGPDVVVTGNRGTFEQVGGIPITSGCAGNAACQSGLNGSGELTAQSEAEKRRVEVPQEPMPEIEVCGNCWRPTFDPDQVIIDFFNLSTFAATPIRGAGTIAAAKAVAKLPANARTTLNPQEIYRRLEKFHGIDPAKAGDRLHDIKKSAGLGPADNVVFDSPAMFTTEPVNGLAASLWEGSSEWKSIGRSTRSCDMTHFKTRRLRSRIV